MLICLIIEAFMKVIWMKKHNLKAGPFFNKAV